MVNPKGTGMAGMVRILIGPRIMEHPQKVNASWLLLVALVIYV